MINSIQCNLSNCQVSIKFSLHVMAIMKVYFGLSYVKVRRKSTSYAE